MSTHPISHTKKFRTIWISDLHLGSRACRAEDLHEFLQSFKCEKLYLVGDIVDTWALQRNVHWPISHSAVLQEILAMADRGVEVVYVPGNHDEVMRRYEKAVFGGVVVKNQVIHETVDGRTLLIIHGDEFDQIVQCGNWKKYLGDVGYDSLIWLNRIVNAFRRQLGLPYWSLASHIKHKVKDALVHIDWFTQAAAHEAAKRGFDGIVCGHLHVADMREVNGVLYCNDGDWVESCSAMVENLDGTLELIRWPAMQTQMKNSVSPDPEVNPLEDAA